MKKALLMLLATAVVGLSVAPLTADASVKKNGKHVKSTVQLKKSTAQLKSKSKSKSKKTAQLKSKSKKHARVITHIRYSRQGASPLLSDSQVLALESSAVLVQDQATGAVLYEKNANAVLPIASITKLMTAMVALDASPDLKETLIIGMEDVDLLKGTHSRLNLGTQLSREEMLRLALMSSENRAASALSRHYPGGQKAFVAAMNVKAKMLGLNDTRFFDPTGLTALNVSSSHDLAKMVSAAHQYPLIREFTTTVEEEVNVAGRSQQFHNTNALVKSPAWQIGLSKTGYISEAGRCLVMQAWINSKPTIIVLLDSVGKMTRVGDANRIKRWVEAKAPQRLPTS
ncbi:MAG: D-alanyl-D-alanine endopeptidase [Rugosibacter sp.]|nr:D-alanyl-D-alanine endopeptidase [Rugosibacter sp.]MDO9271664.1 D-alanyl-D-alanine endopeptidase [Rugosibacter sp.]